MHDHTAHLAIRSSVARILFMIISIGIAFFMMPFVIRKLGDTWYGILTLVQVLTGYYYFADLGLASAVSRYVTLYVSKKDFKNTNIIINTSLAIYVAMAFFICFLTMTSAYFAGYFVPDKAILQIVRIMIVIMGLNLAMEFPFKAFAGIMGAFMRYDLLSVSHLGTLILSTILTVMFLNMGYGVIALSVIGFICSQVSNIIFYRIAKYLFPGMSIRKEYFRKDRMRELFGYSVWSFVMQIGDQLRFRVDSFVIGWALGAVYVTHFSIGASVASYLLVFIFRATNFLTPLFTKYYAEGDNEAIRSKLLLATKVNTILAAFGGGLIIIVGESFLTRWVGTQYLDTYPVLVILTVAVILEAIQTPANNVLMAIAKHRFFAIINTGEGLCNLAISIALVKRYGMLGVALGTLVPLVVSRLIVMPIYLARCIGLSFWRFYANIAVLVPVTAMYLLGVYLATESLFNLPRYDKLIVLCFISVPIYMLLIIFLFLDKSERAFVKRMVPERIRFLS